MADSWPQALERRTKAGIQSLKSTMPPAARRFARSRSIGTTQFLWRLPPMVGSSAQGVPEYESTKIWDLGTVRELKNLHIFVQAFSSDGPGERLWTTATGQKSFSGTSPADNGCAPSRCLSSTYRVWLSLPTARGYWLLAPRSSATKPLPGKKCKPFLSRPAPWPSPGTENGWLHPPDHRSTFGISTLGANCKRSPANWALKILPSALTASCWLPATQPSDSGTWPRESWSAQYQAALRGWPIAPTGAGWPPIPKGLFRFGTLGLGRSSTPLRQQANTSGGWALALPNLRQQTLLPTESSGGKLVSALRRSPFGAPLTPQRAAPTQNPCPLQHT